MSTLILTLDFPRGPTGQNSRLHWRAKSAKTRAARQATCEVVADAINGESWPAADFAFRIFYPDLRARDMLNTIEGMKADIDGIVDAGLIPDDDWTRVGSIRIDRTLDRDRPRIELTLTRCERFVEIKVKGYKP